MEKKGIDFTMAMIHAWLFPDTQEHMKMACWRLVALIIKNTRR